MKAGQLCSSSHAQRWAGMAGMGCGAVCWGYGTLLQALSGCVKWCFSWKRRDFIFLTYFILRFCDMRARSSNPHCLQESTTSGSVDKWMCPETGAGPKCLRRWTCPVSSRRFQLGVFWCRPVLHGTLTFPDRGRSGLLDSVKHLSLCSLLFTSSFKILVCPSVRSHPCDFPTLVFWFPCIHEKLSAGIWELQGSLSFTHACPFHILCSCLL